jgi:hypothetical protein
MTIWKAPPPATLLGMILFGTGGLLGTTVGGWILPAGEAFAKGGWAAVGLVPTQWIFPILPDMTDTWSKLMNYGTAIFAILGLSGGLVLSQRLWRYIVVKKPALMTDADVEEFYKRDPGF